MVGSSGLARIIHERLGHTPGTTPQIGYPVLRFKQGVHLHIPVGTTTTDGRSAGDARSVFLEVPWISHAHVLRINITISAVRLAHNHVDGADLVPLHCLRCGARPAGAAAFHRYAVNRSMLRRGGSPHSGRSIGIEVGG